MALTTSNQDLILSAEPSQVSSSPARWQALNATLNRNLQGVGGFPSLGPGYQFAKIQSATPDFRRWVVSDDEPVGLNVRMVTETGLPIIVAGTPIVSFGAEDGKVYYWSLVLAGAELRIGYIKATGTVQLRYTTNETGFVGKPVYVITTPNKGQNQEMVLAAKGILEQLQIGAKVQRLVIAPNRSLDPNATNPWSPTVLLADITGSLAVSATDLFTVSGSVPMTYKYQDPLINNASTLTVSTATITGGVLRNLFTGTIQARNLVLSAPSALNTELPAWGVVQATAIGTLAMSAANGFDISGTVEVNYVSRDQAWGAGPSYTVKQATLRTNIVSNENSFATLFSGDVTATNVVFIPVAAANGTGSQWQAQAFDASGNLKLGVVDGFEINATASISWRRSDRDLNGITSFRVNTATLKTGEAETEGNRKGLFSGEITVNNAVFGLAAGTGGSGNQWQAQSFEATGKVALNAIPGFAVSSDAKVTWKRSDSNYDNATTLVVNSATLKLTDSESDSSLKGLFNADVTVNNLVLKLVSKPDGSGSEWQAQSFAANGNLNLGEVAGFSSNANASVIFKRNDPNFANASTIRIGEANLAGGVDLANHGWNGLFQGNVQATDLVLSQAAGTSGTGGWQVESFNVGGNSNLNVPGFNLAGKVVDLKWQRRDPAANNQSSLTIKEGSITAGAGNGLLKADALASDVVLVAAAGGGWQPKSWTATGSLNLATSQLNAEATATLQYLANDPALNGQDCYRISTASMNANVSAGLLSGTVNATDVVITAKPASDGVGNDWELQQWNANSNLLLDATGNGGFKINGQASIAFNAQDTAVLDAYGQPMASYRIQQASLKAPQLGLFKDATLAIENLVVTAQQTSVKAPAGSKDPFGDPALYYREDSETTSNKRFYTNDEAVAKKIWNYDVRNWSATTTLALADSRIKAAGAVAITYDKINAACDNKETYTLNTASLVLTSTESQLFAGQTQGSGLSIADAVISRANSKWEILKYKAAANLSFQASDFSLNGSAQVSYESKNSAYQNAATFTISSATLQSQANLQGVISTGGKVSVSNLVLKSTGLSTPNTAWEVLGYNVSGDFNLNIEGLKANGSASLTYTKANAVYAGSPETLKLNSAAVELTAQNGLTSIFSTASGSISANNVLLAKTSNNQWQVQEYSVNGAIKIGTSSSDPITIDANASVVYRREDRDHAGLETVTISSAQLKTGANMADFFNGNAAISANNVVLQKTSETGWSVLEYQATTTINVKANNNTISSDLQANVLYKRVDTNYANKSTFTVQSAKLEGSLLSSGSTPVALNGSGSVSNLVLVKEQSGWQAQSLNANANLNITVGTVNVKAKGMLDYQLRNSAEKDNQGNALTSFLVKDTVASVSIADVNGIRLAVNDAYVVDGKIKSMKGSASLAQFYDFKNVTLAINHTTSNATSSSVVSLYGDYQKGSEIWRGAVKAYLNNGTIDLKRGTDIVIFKPGSYSQATVGLGYSSDSADISGYDQGEYGPLHGEKVFFDQRNYDENGKFLDNSNLKADASEQYATTGAIGDFKFTDKIGPSMDGNKDTVVDYKDGLLVALPDPTGAITDSVSGIKIDLPLVGILGGSLNVLTTLKYTSLLRWQPGKSILIAPNDSREVSPQLITDILSSRLKDVPESFLRDDDHPYTLLISQDKNKREQALHSLEFSYTYLSIIEAIKTIFDSYKLVYGSNEGYGNEDVLKLWNTTGHLDPEGVDQAGVVAFSALENAILSRFGPTGAGINPSDPYGRSPVAAQFDPLNRSHLRALLLEVLAQNPLQVILKDSQLTVDQFRPANRLATAPDGAENNGKVIAAIESHFGSFLDEVTDGLTSQLQSLADQFALASKVSNQIPTLCNEVVIPGIAGLKRDLEGSAIANLIKQAVSHPDGSTAPAPYNTVARALYIDSPDRVMEGVIQLTKPGIIEEEGILKARFPVVLRSAKTGELLIPPPYGLTLRFRLGGSAREGVDYQVSDQQRYRTLWIPPGQMTSWIDLELNAASVINADTLQAKDSSAIKPLVVQLEMLSADSGFAVDGEQAVAHLPLIAGNGSDYEHGQVMNRSGFEPFRVIEGHQVGSQWVVKSDPNSPNAVLRGRSDGANTFLLMPSAIGLPHIENFDASRDKLAIGGDWLASDATQEPTALTQAAVIAGLVVDNNSGQPLALISNYSVDHGDQAYGSLHDSATPSLIQQADQTLSSDWLVKTSSGATQRIGTMSRLSFSFNSKLHAILGRKEGYELVMQSTDGAGQAIGSGRVLLAQLGQAAGDPVGFNLESGRAINLGKLSKDLTTEIIGGNAQFSLRNIATGSSQTLDLIAPTPAEVSQGLRRFSLSLAGQAIASLELLSPAEQQNLPDPVEGYRLTKTQTGNAEGTDQLTGLGLDKLGAFVSGQERKIELTATIYREAVFDNTVGFGLLRKTDGALLNASDGGVVGHTTDADFLKNLRGHAVWLGKGLNSGPVAVKETFTLAGSVNLGEVYLLPFIQVGSSGTIYTSGRGLNEGVTHIESLAPSIYGFEDLPKGGDFDFNDVIVEVQGLKALGTNPLLTA